MTAPVKLLRAAEVMDRCGIGRTMLYGLIKAGAFPAPVKVGRGSRWRSDEIDRWIEGQPRAAA